MSSHVKYVDDNIIKYEDKDPTNKLQWRYNYAHPNLLFTCKISQTKQTEFSWTGQCSHVNSFRSTSFNEVYSNSILCGESDFVLLIYLTMK